MNQKRVITVELPEELRQLLVKTIRILNVDQKTLAGESGTKQSWLSMVLTGRRKNPHPQSLQQLCAALKKRLEKYEGEDKTRLCQQFDQELLPFCGMTMGEAAGFQSADYLRIAADALELITQRCQSKTERLKVTEHLMFAVQHQKF